MAIAHMHGLWQVVNRYADLASNASSKNTRRWAAPRGGATSLMCIKQLVSYTPSPSYAMLGLARGLGSVVSMHIYIYGLAHPCLASWAQPQHRAHSQHCMIGGGGWKADPKFRRRAKAASMRLAYRVVLLQPHVHHNDEWASDMHRCRAATSRKQDLTGTSWSPRATHIGVKKLSGETNLQT